MPPPAQQIRHAPPHEKKKQRRQYCRLMRHIVYVPYNRPMQGMQYNPKGNTTTPGAGVS